MKISRKFLSASVVGVLSLCLSAAALAAEPVIKTQKIHDGAVKLSVPTVVGAMGGASVDDKINMQIDLNTLKRLYAYLPATKTSELEFSKDFYSMFAGDEGAKESREFVEDISDFVGYRLNKDAKAAYKAGSSVKKYNVDGQYTVTFNSDEFLSIQQSFNDYLGGAHPNHYIATLNADLKTGRILTLGDMFKKGSNYLEQLNAIVDQQEAATKDQKAYFQDIKVTGGEKFYVTDNADLVIVYAPYEVAPYAAGTVKFIVPIAEVKDIFNFQLQ